MMIPYGIKNRLKSFSLGNLSMINDDNAIDFTDARVYQVSSVRNDKHNLSSTNELIRDMCLKLKEFTKSALSNLTDVTAKESNYPSPLPENNLKQVCSNKEIYQQQSAIWELLVTEQNFLKQIHFIVQIYVFGFETLRPKYFPKVMSEEIFSNLKEVSRVSFEFWKHCMKPIIENYEATRQMFKPRLLKNGFIKIGEILEPYILYCTEISKCRSSILSLEKSNELFAEYIKWAMNFEESNREMLCDHLAKPFLRLTKYKILLQAIHKYSGLDEKKEIQEMIDAVDTFVSRVNEKIEEANLMKKLQNLNSFIDAYDVIEPLGDDLIPIINQYSKLDLTAPIHFGKESVIREILFQGSVKLREGPSKTIDVKLFLLTDILLITKFKKKHLGKLKVIKPPIYLDAIHVQKHNTNSFICVCLNDFNCISALYHFSNGDQKKIDDWTETLQQASKNYSKVKSKYMNSSISKEFPECIPTLKVDKSSPKCERFRTKSPSNSESLEYSLHNDFSFKRKAPVTKKHKSKREIINSKPKSASVVPQRKNSNPILKPTSSSFSEKNKLYKSNSFAEDTEKSKIRRNMSDCSDIDEPNENSQNALDYGSGSFHNVLNSEKTDKIGNLQASIIPSSTDFVIKDNRKSYSRKENISESDFHNFETKLEKKLSISLNTLGTK